MPYVDADRPWHRCCHEYLHVDVVCANVRGTRSFPQHNGGYIHVVALSRSTSEGCQRGTF